MQYPGPTLIVNQGDSVTGQPQQYAAGGDTEGVDRVSRPVAGQRDLCAGRSRLHRRRLDQGSGARQQRQLHLRRRPARHLPLSQRQQPVAAGRHGPGGRADRAPDRLQSLHAGQPQGVCAGRHHLRPRVPVPADRNGCGNPRHGLQPGAGRPADRCRHLGLLRHHVVHQRPQCARYAAGGRHSVAAEPALQCGADHASGRQGAGARDQRRARPASFPPPRRPHAADGARRPRAGKRGRRRARPGRARLHHPQHPRPDHGPDVRVDRQEPWLGHLRHQRRPHLRARWQRFQPDQRVVRRPRQAVPGDPAQPAGRRLRRVLQRQPRIWASSASCPRAIPA